MIIRHDVCDVVVIFMAAAGDGYFDAFHFKFSHSLIFIIYFISVTVDSVLTW